MNTKCYFVYIHTHTHIYIYIYMYIHISHGDCQLKVVQKWLNQVASFTILKYKKLNYKVVIGLKSVIKLTNTSMVSPF